MLDSAGRLCEQPIVRQKIGKHYLAGIGAGGQVGGGEVCPTALYEQRAFEAGCSLHVECQDPARVFQGLTAQRQHERLPLAKAP
jgi:hypothetical protein